MLVPRSVEHGSARRSDARRRSARTLGMYCARTALTGFWMVFLAARQAAPQAASGRASEIALVRDLTLGGGEPQPEYEFSTVGHAAVTRGGMLFLSMREGSASVIRRYDPNGRFIGTVGRSGSGPGEYRSVEGMAMVGDTLLVVLDVGNRRVVLFDTAGIARGSFGVEARSFAPRKSLAITSGDLIGVRAMIPDASMRPTDGIPSGFIRYRLNGSVQDTIRVPAELNAGLLSHRSLGPRWPFSDANVFAVLKSGGVATARTTSYRVRVSSGSGRPQVLQRSVRALPLEGLEREEWSALLRLASPGVPVPRLPSYKPVIRDLHADSDGRVWVSLYTTAERRIYPPRPGVRAQLDMTMWEHNAYDIFREGGQYLGRVDLPPFARLLAVSGDRIWTSQETEDGDYLVTRYRVNARVW
jgi:hypothetical protein